MSRRDGNKKFKKGNRPNYVRRRFDEKEKDGKVGKYFWKIESYMNLVEEVLESEEREKEAKNG